MQDKDKPDTGRDVTVSVDGNAKAIHRGSYKISDLKAALEVEEAKLLVIVENGQMRELHDDERLTIKGGEIFFTRVRAGGSS